MCQPPVMLSEPYANQVYASGEVTPFSSCYAGGFLLGENARASRDPQREQYWRSLLGEWRQSGLMVYAFCKDRDLQKTTFCYWQCKLGFAAS